MTRDWGRSRSFCPLFCSSKKADGKKDALTLAIRASQSSQARSLCYVLRQALNFARAHCAPGSGFGS